MVELISNYLDTLPQIPLSKEDSVNKVKIQQALNIIWNLTEIFMPGNQNASMKVPSYRLVELGILSEKAAMKIDERVKQGLVDKNRIFFEREKGGIKILETYREGSAIYNVDPTTLTEGAPSQLRRDGFTVEQLFLMKRSNSRIVPRLSKGILHPNYYELVDGKEIEDSIASPNGYKPEMIPVPITPKALNTTIALLIEGGIKIGAADKYFNERKA